MFGLYGRGVFDSQYREGFLVDVSLKLYEGDTVISTVWLATMADAVEIAKELMAFLNGEDGVDSVYSYGATNEKILASIKRGDYE